MSNDNKKTLTQPKAQVKSQPVIVPPLFRKIDWLTLIMTFGVVWAVYIWTLAPELTLEDSGELCTGSFYAGIPHPPGYPFWSIYSWFWTFILPFGNVAWRVEMGESFAAAMGCGLLGLMVSRGSSMLIEGIEELRGLTGRWETAICVISGFVAGTLLGLDGYMWKESVAINRISLFGVPWIIGVLVCLMRWVYAPQQRRYLYLAMLCYGICATIHQTLLLSAMGIEVLIALVLPKLGRDLFLTNSIIYLIGLMLMGIGNIPAINNMASIEVALFHIVGIGSILAGVGLWMKTGEIFTEWKTVLFMGLVWCVGISFYFYMPVSGMTCPPMQWGYPRTVEGFFHALSRGQYETLHGTNIFQNPSQFVFQIWYLMDGLAGSFSWVYMFVGLLPFLFLKKMHARERNWIIGVSSIYLCIAVLLVILLNVTPDRSSSDLNKVFCTASHGLFAMMIGYGLTLLAAYVATHYQKFRRWGLLGGVVALGLSFYCLVETIGQLFFGKAGQMKIAWLPFDKAGFWEFLPVGPNGEFTLGEVPHWFVQAFAPGQYNLPIFADIILIAIPLLFIAALLVYRQRGPVLILLGLFLVMPVCSGLSHWYKSEQRNHWFGYWFGHDMFTPPYKDPQTGKLSYDNDRRKALLKDPKNARLIYPEMARDTVLFGGTDPGRFCPTYTIFCESFIPHRCQPEQDQKFDRRDVYIITQNALADGTYLEYLRSQYNRSKQIDPPFFSELSKYLFTLAIHGWRTATGSALDKNVNNPDLQPDAQMRQMLVSQESDIVQSIASSGLYELVNKSLYYTLDVPFTKWGKYVENRRRAEGVYPPVEIHIPSEQESQNCFREYTEDVGRRAQLNQLRPGEDVHVDAGGRVQVSGQVAVMNINGLLCKVIFDACPTNEFYVEESFPLDWMYPYETPFGIIMKINRKPLPELTQDIFDLDHKFWTDFTPRLCGSWITYDTSVKEICDFAERTYVKNNFKGYTGDRAFVRDDDGQKAFSKLRSSQAGVYAWRLSPQCPPEYRQKSKATEEALIKETDFAFKQAFAFCPYSPEAVFRYINFLLPLGRFDDAIMIAETCKTLDPYNEQIGEMIGNLKKYKEQNEDRMKAVSQIGQMEDTARTNPADVHNLVVLGVTYVQLQNTNRAMELMDVALASPHANVADVSTIAAFYSQLNNMPKLEAALQKLAALTPDQPESFYRLAELQSFLNKTNLALASLKQALDLNAQRLKTNPGAPNLLTEARKSPYFNSLRALPEFNKLVPPQ
jgi:tetratricopeptide (TPR) repeat protein